MATHFKGTEQETIALNAFITLMRASDSVTRRLSRHLASVNLTLSQFGVLEILLHLGPLCQRDLGQKLLKSGGNITMVIDNLEKIGLVKRNCDPTDRRSQIVSLTEDGETFINKYFPQHLVKIIEEFSVLTLEEQQELARLCKKVGLGE